MMNCKKIKFTKAGAMCAAELEVLWEFVTRAWYKVRDCNKSFKKVWVSLMQWKSTDFFVGHWSKVEADPPDSVWSM